MKNTVQMVAYSVAGLTLFCGILYGSYWVAKTVSYSLFYEDMVKQTVIEMVRPESLR